LKKILLYSFITSLCCSFSTNSFASWKFDSSGVGYVDSHQSNASKGMADLIVSMNGTKQIIIRAKPLSPQSCQPQGLKNGDRGYIVRSKIFVNDTLVYAKKFIEPSSKGKCFIHYTGETAIDKQFIISEFSKASDVFIEIDGADDRKATKYRGEQVVITGMQRLGGGAFTAQVVYDTEGKKHDFITVPSSDIRWYRFTTANFKNVWSKT
jgi:hypothetical protein